MAQFQGLDQHYRPDGVRSMLEMLQGMTVLVLLFPTIPSVLVQYIPAKTDSFSPHHLWVGII